MMIMKPIEIVRRENLAAAVLELFNDNQTAAAKTLGHDKPTQVNHWITGFKNMSTPSARKIEEKFGLAKFWMDAEHKSSTRDASISGPKGGLFKEIPTIVKDSINGDGPKRFDKNVTPARIGQRAIPVISYVQAGMMTEVVDPFALGDGLETILTDLDVSEQTFALIIDGPSMLPEFNEGDKVIIDPAASPRPGDFVVAKNGKEEATFKKYRPRGTSERGDMVFELVPLNDDFPVLNSERDHLQIIGVMVEHRKYRRR
ncbi:LexA repressor [Paraburkholderia aspalathi]|uniref:LexA family protein n=1 Tax=Paraburkholderia aspalathi TaxID=1324617 RepID=UPI001B1D9DC4|nr:S24 family peptidase [Paraburkholderia aspalathi]CAE6811070.1 LexA repressor [Paraburkholderia aspalathi]